LKEGLMLLGITDETKLSAYEEVLETLGRRQLNVFNELALLGEEGATANELAMKMYRKGYFITPERNRVHPRLHELVKDDVVFIKEKRRCSITKKNCAVYVAKKQL
jgi:hypothetical protein